MLASFGGMGVLGRLGQGTQEVDHGRREEGRGDPDLVRLVALQLRRWLKDGGDWHLAPAPVAHHRPQLEFPSGHVTARPTCTTNCQGSRPPKDTTQQ